MKLTKQDLIQILNQNKNILSDSESQKSAQKSLEILDFPTKKTETWKHTNLNPLLKHQFLKTQKTDIDQKHVNNLTIHKLNSQKVVFVNGYYAADKSMQSSDNRIVVCSMSEAKEKHPELVAKYFNKSDAEKDNIFSALNVAYAETGFFIYIPKNIQTEQVIHVLNFTDGNNQKVLKQTHNLIIAEANAQVEIISSYHSLSTDYTLTNVITEIYTAQDASVNYNLFQGQGDDAFQVQNTKVRQEKGSRFSMNTTTLCGALVRNDITVNHIGEYCDTQLNGLYLPDKEQHFDNCILINHNKPNCESSQFYRGIIDNRAEAVFLVKVYVAKDAQKTNAEQSNKNVLLTDYAKAHSKPQLEIYADDVACAHGSTIGQLDKEAIFYLRTRGISEKNARALMLGAFIGDAVNKISLKPYRDFVNFLVNKRLKGEDVTGLCAIKICPSC